jgi:dATP pyrophosphohydrolase
VAQVCVRVVDAYVFRRTGEGIRFLLLQRNVDRIYEHLWQGVAGKIQPGETAWEAALRELKEETQLQPVRMFVADHVSTFYETHGDRINLVPVFGIEVDSDRVVLSDEHRDYRWVTLDEALELLVWRGQRAGIRTVYEMITREDDRLRWSHVELKP